MNNTMNEIDKEYHIDVLNSIAMMFRNNTDKHNLYFLRYCKNIIREGYYVDLMLIIDNIFTNMSHNKEELTIFYKEVVTDQ